MQRWVVLYDGDCGLCKWLLSLLLIWDRDQRLRPLALQRSEAVELTADMTAEQRAASWHLISPDGTRRSAGAALAPALALLPGGRAPAAILARMPRTAEAGYRWVAGHRVPLSRLVPTSLKRRATERVLQRESALRR